ncbi:hypothetical protein Zm00014a_018440 [Zea mays]|nr:hypothetical protein ZEAMMB73_Zm00001d014546 [Zea mays]AQL09250.1 hypothetical protein ZEAMMB73_Zm00001d048265 [Zea mays]PWZ14754.1 hypothetical protein Zm00014a_018440 [Zea mays]
MQEASPI